MQKQLGKVTIASQVLVTIARLTALKTPGVARLDTHIMDGVNRVFRRGDRHAGVKVEVDGDSVSVELHVIAEHDANMLTLGQEVQTAISRAIREMVGMSVTEVNVYIQDVLLPGDRGAME
ncbi:MAG: Asp23/Gls24 family envelope stress response protein [Anaerolineae bacterium]